MTKQKLTKFTLGYNEKKQKWDLEKDKTNALVKSFVNKTDAVKGGALKKATGSEPASVKIQKKDGKFQEERTYPKSLDPKSSKG